ncbi:MAG TPA: proprotein convertase P-domain-containing protein [Saprospiraceae bacterium]|nr:proprotein convertase P-domain-containing protein [Saprospiraceae bacterium]
MLIQTKPFLIGLLFLFSLASYGQPPIRPIPPGCSSLNSNSFCDNTTYFIADLNTIVIPIVVSGLGTSIFDIDVFTAIAHTFPGDLDIVLTSPSGKTVTLTSDNAGTSDNVFNGTTWNDNGAIGVADATYAVSVVNPSLKPEEGLGNFFGDNPNGTWMLTITDDLTGDAGQITSICLDIASTASPLNQTTTAFPNNTSTPIADNGVTFSNILVTGLGNFITDVDLSTFITHSFAADLEITIISPLGTIVTLTTDNGAGNDNVFNGTIWDDFADDPVTDHVFTNLILASPLSPETGLAAFIGENPNGNWNLRINDDAAIDTGTLSSWNLSISTGECAAIPTLSQWGFIILMLCSAIIGLVVFLQVQLKSRVNKAIN